MRQAAGIASAALNRAVELVVTFLMALLVLDVWVGVIDRYIFHWQLPWPEIVARYLMIWTVLLAVSCGIARREHIGLTIVIDLMPRHLMRAALIIADLLAMILFLYVLWFGWGFAMSGLNRQAMIFGMSLGPAFAAIPVSATLAALQLAFVLVRDGGGHAIPDQVSEAE